MNANLPCLYYQMKWLIEMDYRLTANNLYSIDSNWRTIYSLENCTNTVRPMLRVSIGLVGWLVFVVVSVLRSFGIDFYSGAFLEFHLYWSKRAHDVYFILVNRWRTREWKNMKRNENENWFEHIKSGINKMNWRQFNRLIRIIWLMNVDHWFIMWAMSTQSLFLLSLSLNTDPPN